MPPGPGTPQAAPAQPPTFYMPLQRDPRETAQVAASQDANAGRPFSAFAQASHEATVENLQAQIAELKLKKLKAELEADELRKNPRRLFKDEKSSAETKNEPRMLDRLARVPAPLLPIPAPAPTPTPSQPTVPPAPPSAPPQMRVRMVTLEPKEAVIEAGENDGRGWFRVHEGQKFPDFVVTTIEEGGVTIAFAGRGIFYPVGGSALGTSAESRQTASRPNAEPPRR